MMGETSLTFIPLDDPIKKPFEEIIENGYDGSDVTKLKGKEKNCLTKRMNYHNMNLIVFAFHTFLSYFYGFIVIP